MSSASPSSSTASISSKTTWYCPLDVLPSNDGKGHCHHAIDLMNIVVNYLGPNLMEVLCRMELVGLLNAAIREHLNEHLQSIGLFIDDDLSGFERSTVLV
jgi:hypothetical protein